MFKVIRDADGGKDYRELSICWLDLNSQPPGPSIPSVATVTTCKAHDIELLVGVSPLVWQHVRGLRAANRLGEVSQAADIIV